MLTVRGLEVLYGPIRAVRGIDLDVKAGEIVALIGANGAGKTTTVRAIAGLTAFRGEIAYDGRKLRPNRPSSTFAPASRWCPKVAASSAA